MGFIVGTDEAGYGPYLGPLVISASVWWLPDDAPDTDLYRRLRKVVAPRPPRDPARHRGRVAMADSKTLYSTATGLGLLERGLLSAVGLMGERPAAWRALWELLCPDALPCFDSAPWFVGYDLPLPVANELKSLERAIARLSSGCQAAQVRLLRIESRAVFPDQWNDALEHHGNKAAALSHLTLELLMRVLERLPDGPVAVICDKHGGRNTYGSLLQQHVVDWLVEVYEEGSEVSRYRWGPESRRIEVAFRPRAERFLPAALASMASKYLRELAMRPFNDFWLGHVPELRPTAGYSRDARRFKAEIGAAQTALGIDDRMVWRAR